MHRAPAADEGPDLGVVESGDLIMRKDFDALLIFMWPAGDNQPRRGRQGLGEVRDEECQFIPAGVATGFVETVEDDGEPPGRHLALEESGGEFVFVAKLSSATMFNAIPNRFSSRAEVLIEIADAVEDGQQGRKIL